MSDNYITRPEYRQQQDYIDNTFKKMSGDIERVADRVDKITIVANRNSQAIRNHDEAFQKFDAAMDKLSDMLARVDKETLINTERLAWMRLVNWKTISAVGAVMAIILQMILNAWVS